MVLHAWCLFRLPTIASANSCEFGLQWHIIPADHFGALATSVALRCVGHISPADLFGALATSFPLISSVCVGLHLRPHPDGGGATLSTSSAHDMLLAQGRAWILPTGPVDEYASQSGHRCRKVTICSGKSVRGTTVRRDKALHTVGFSSATDMKATTILSAVCAATTSMPLCGRARTEYQRQQSHGSSVQAKAVRVRAHSMHLTPPRHRDQLQFAASTARLPQLRHGPPSPESGTSEHPLRCQTRRAALPRRTECTALAIGVWPAVWRQVVHQGLSKESRDKPRAGYDPNQG